MEPLSDERFLEIINRSTLALESDDWQWYAPQARKDVQALVNEVVRLRGVIYGAKEIHVEQWRWVNRLEGLLRGEGDTKD